MSSAAPFRVLLGDCISSVAIATPFETHSQHEHAVAGGDRGSALSASSLLHPLDLSFDRSAGSSEALQD